MPVSITSVAFDPTTIPTLGTRTTLPSGIAYECGASLTVTCSLTIGSGRFCGGCCAHTPKETTTDAASTPARTDSFIVMQGFYQRGAVIDSLRGCTGRGNRSRLRTRRSDCDSIDDGTPGTRNRCRS